MKFLKQFIQFILGLIFLGLIIWGAVALTDWFFNLDIDKEFKLTFISATSALFMFIWSNYLNKKREIEARLFEKKAEAYSRIFEKILDGLTIPGYKLVLADVYDIQKDILVWGNAEMIKFWNKFTDLDFDNLQMSEKKMKDFFNSYETLLKIMRKDLGHNDSELKHGDVIKFFLDKKGKEDFDDLFRSKS
ncbi:hypothetical protein EP073_04770 [Geovibrio thiophilus]|uniref:DUF4760 domain-containing protein n=1 Tax=Geovibrio thiophilus TaxID=139438 RepID=A0A410JXI0_9BACT|nr:hypothetical protein [Geovibrio thiophilus]QAR32741.1 hypothetical protein EP073_04770 [Geovibrio thiophilus]